MKPILLKHFPRLLVRVLIFFMQITALAPDCLTNGADVRCSWFVHADTVLMILHPATIVDVKLYTTRPLMCPVYGYFCYSPSRNSGRVLKGNLLKKYILFLQKHEFCVSPSKRTLTRRLPQASDSGKIKGYGC